MSHTLDTIGQLICPLKKIYIFAIIQLFLFSHHQRVISHCPLSIKHSKTNNMMFKDLSRMNNELYQQCALMKSKLILSLTMALLISMCIEHVMFSFTTSFCVFTYFNVTLCLILHFLRKDTPTFCTFLKLLLHCISLPSYGHFCRKHATLSCKSSSLNLFDKYSQTHNVKIKVKTVSVNK